MTNVSDIRQTSNIDLFILCITVVFMIIGVEAIGTGFVYDLDSEWIARVAAGWTLMCLVTVMVLRQLLTPKRKG